MAHVGLSDAIAALRRELLEACWDAQGQHLLFRLSPVELTLQMGVTDSGRGHAGINWCLISLGTDAQREIAATQTVKLTLEIVATSAEGQIQEFFVAADESTGNSSNSTAEIRDDPADS